MNIDNIDISFLIPTLNELNNINKIYLLLVEIQKEINIKSEIIFIDDKSNDGSLELLKKLNKEKKIKLVIPNIRKGLGYALVKGMNESIGSYCIFLDCDLSVTKNDILNLIKLRRRNKVIIGGRYMKNSNSQKMEYKRYYLSYLLNLILSIILSIKISDLTHSFRIIPNISTEKINVYTHPGFFIQLAYFLKKNNFDFMEIPITNKPRLYGNSKNKISSMITSIIKSIFLINKIK